MGLSFSKGFGKSRITVSSKGVYGSVGLGGGLRYGSRIGGGTTKKSQPDVDLSDLGGITNFSLKEASLWISLCIVCVIPTVLGYMYLWTLLAHFLAICAGSAAAIMLTAAAIGDYKRSK
jgi:hypothetical protein